jgi:hypothetical protein
MRVKIKTPTQDDLVDYLDGEMLPSDLVDILRHLKFDDGKATLQVDRAARDYLGTSVTARHGNE